MMKSGKLLRSTMVLALFAVSMVLLEMSAMAASPASGQDYPSRAITFVVPYNPGGSYDTIARLIGQKLTELWHQPVLIENRPGAGSLVGTEFAAKAEPDGYTLAIFGNAHATLPALHTKASFNVQKDFAPISLVGATPAFIVVNPSLPVKTISELIKLAKAKPGELNFGSGGNGSTTHLGMEMFLFATGIDIVHIPYKAGVPATMDLIAGQTQVGLLDLISARAHVESGKLHPLAITSKERSPFFPNVPSIVEAGVNNYTYREWYGITTKAGTPREVIAKLNGAIKQIVADPSVKKRITDMGTTIMTNTPEEFAAFFDKEIKMNADAVKRAGVKRD